jgi:hypothetical protein
MRRFVSVAAVAAVAVGLSAAPDVQAATFNFTNITNNSDVDVAAQLTVEVTEAFVKGAAGASFTFFNSVDPTYASITAVYFDDSIPLLGEAMVDQVNTTAGVSFTEGATPPVLPGGNGSPYNFNVTGSADSDSPHPVTNGVDNATESLTIIFALLGGFDFDDLLAALLNGDFRIGMHVQAIAGTTFGTDSDSFLNTTPIDPVPLPAGLVLLLTGSAGAGVLGRYKVRRREISAI